MAFKGMPAQGTEIPEANRPPTSVNAALHELPACREYTHDLKGVPLFLPRTRLAVVPVRLTPEGAWDCAVLIGSDTYPRGGYDLYVTHWELQRALAIVLDLNPVSTHPDSVHGGVQLAECADGTIIKVRRTARVSVPRDPAYRDPANSGPTDLFYRLRRPDETLSRTGHYTGIPD